MGAVLHPNSSVTFDVYGINQENISTPIYSDLTNNALINIDTLNTVTYPNVKLVTKLSIDTLSGLESPVYKSTDFKYTPYLTELLPDNNSFTGSDTSGYRKVTVFLFGKIF